MFKNEGLYNYRKIKWQHVKPGTVILAGADINGHMIPELSSYPVLTNGLLGSLMTKYMLFNNRTLLIADVRPGYSAWSVSDNLMRDRRAFQDLSEFRTSFFQLKQKILSEMGLPSAMKIPLLSQPESDSSPIEQNHLVKDTYNSFSYMYGMGDDLPPLPSFLNHPDLALSLGDLLTGQLAGKLNLPDDKEVTLHLVVDFSGSMDTGGKLRAVLDVIKQMEQSFFPLLPNTRVKYYAFSDICRPVQGFRNTSVRRGDTSYSSFMKQVVHHRDYDKTNKVIVFSDGNPTDRSEAMKLAQTIKTNHMDYTQIILNIREEQRNEVIIPEGSSIQVVDNIALDAPDDLQHIMLNDAELNEKMEGIFGRFTEIAEACGGNQIILKVNKVMNIVAVECYDRYLGLLTLASPEQTTKIMNETWIPPAEGEVRKWNFRKL